MLRALPQMEDIFGEAQKDIGSEPIVDLPPRPGEPSAGMGGKIGRGLNQMLGGAATALFSLLPKNSPRRTWVNDVLDWASAKLSSVSQEMEELRNRELLRLMELLKSDPERGLRHALPLGGEPGRGQAPPGAHLGSRLVDFNLRNLGGGRPQDPWHVPWALRQKLIQRYRELALHEQQLGRFKRAAYIHAELLGDLSAAAAVLKEGRFFAEAAILYRDHLHQPHAAAECFVAGGLFAEAIAIYEKQEEWIEIGDLQRRLGREEEAVAAYRHAVSANVAAMNFLGAARLLERQLHEPDEALTLLRRGWHSSAQAAHCLAAEFDLLSRLGRHDTASRRLVMLREENTPAPKRLSLGGVLETVRSAYPDSSVRHAAADLARVKISERLANGDLPDVRTGVQVVAKLAPEDRLLARDASRFLAARTALLQTRKALPPPPPPPRKAGSGRILPPRLLGSISLPKGLTWLAVRRVGSKFFAAAMDRQGRYFLRGNWQGVIQRISAAEGMALTFPYIKALVADEARSQQDFVLILPAAVANAVQSIPPSDTNPAPLQVGAPAWVPRDNLSMSVSGALWWVLRNSGVDLVLEERSPDGRVVGSFDVSDLAANPEPQPGGFCMLALRLHVWISCGRNLILFKGGKIERTYQMESPIVGFEASAPFLACAVVARCEKGVAVFWLDALSDHVEMIASHLTRPRALFLGNGALVLLASESDGRGCEGVVVDIDRRGIHGEEKFYKNGAPPIGLIGTERPDDFAIFDGTDQAQIWRLGVKS